jgi:hypothetical protein
LKATQKNRRIERGKVGFARIKLAACRSDAFLKSTVMFDRDFQSTRVVIGKTG